MAPLEPDAPDPAQDGRFMRRALFLARQSRTHPNPMVGAVVVRGGGEIVGEGWHKGVGTPHAETMAFAEAGNQAHGATLYVTLEPCAHTVSRNGSPRIPCAARCLDAGVARVVAAQEDPDPQVAGQGFARLRVAGVSVRIGVEEQKAQALNYAYLHHRTTGLPFITHKAAMTLDGKIAATGGDSRWITGEASRAQVHRLRDRADALLIGVGTVLADDPSLTTRLPAGNGHDPLRVIIDSTLRTPLTAKIARPGTLLVAVEGNAGAGTDARRAALEAAGVQVVFLPSDVHGKVAVRGVAELLATRGLLDVILEGGGAVAASFWGAGLVSRALYFVAPKIIGGSDALTPVEGAGLSRFMAGAATLGKWTIRRFGPDVALEAETGS